MEGRGVTTLMRNSGKLSETIIWYNICLKVTSATKQQLLRMCHLKHRLRIFLFHRKIMFHSQDIQVFVFLTIP